MKPRHAAALALVLAMVVVIVGCWDVTYFPDPSVYTAGWKCPDPDSHWVAHKIPLCASIPGGVLVKSCFQKTLANVREARGCVAEPSPTPTPTP